MPIIFEKIRSTKHYEAVVKRLDKEGKERNKKFEWGDK